VFKGKNVVKLNYLTPQHESVWGNRADVLLLLSALDGVSGHYIHVLLATQGYR
jgi:hypothetical protein